MEQSLGAGRAWCGGESAKSPFKASAMLTQGHVVSQRDPILASRHSEESAMQEKTVTPQPAPAREKKSKIHADAVAGARCARAGVHAAARDDADRRDAL